MRSIDMQTWSRRNHFKFFSTVNHPHFNMCVNVDVTAFYPFVKSHGYSSPYLWCTSSRGLRMRSPEFCQRIRGRQVVEHDVVNPGFSILIDQDIFTFCNLEYTEDFLEFAKRAEKQISHVKTHPELENDLEKDDMLYMSPIPWVSFTSFTHPMQFHPTDSIPRFA